MEHDIDETEQFASKSTPLERLAEHGDMVLRVVAVAFFIAAVSVIVSLAYKFQ